MENKLFSKINSIQKLLRYEKEFKEVEMEDGRTALVRVKIFGKEIRGRMSFEMGRASIIVGIESKDIKYLKFGYTIKATKGGSVITQFVEFDTGSFIKNLFVKLFFSRKIKNHMRNEVINLITDL